MIDFVLQYWPYFLIGAIELASLISILVVFRKRGISVDGIKAILAKKIPILINLAEASGSSGKEKLGFVVLTALSLIKRYSSKCDEPFWIEYVKEQVEACLSTPQKKEVCVNGEKTLTK